MLFGMQELGMKNSFFCDCNPGVAACSKHKQSDRNEIFCYIGRAAFE